MQHYYGAKAIVQRLGWKDHRRLPWLIKKMSVPAFLRRQPGRSRTCYYASEGMLTAWELTKAKQCREELIAKENEWQEEKREASKRARNSATREDA